MVSKVVLEDVRLAIGKKVGKSTPAVATSLVAIAATTRVGGGVKMSASVRKMDLDSQPHQRWLTGPERLRRQ